MRYHLIKIFLRVAFSIFNRKIHVSGRRNIPATGPLLLAVNHPNSFLDAVITGICFRQPVYFLVRGDVFRNPLVNRILRMLWCIPIYRLSEGKQNLQLNERSFDECLAIFRKKGIVLVFSEGLCENEWKLRSLKKGTARLAFRAWQDPLIDSSFHVLPVGINYHSFQDFGKHIFLNIGTPIDKDPFLKNAFDHQAVKYFTEQLRLQLHSLIVVHDADNVSQKSFQTAFVNAGKLIEAPDETLFGLFREKTEQPAFGQLPLPVTRKFPVAWNPGQRRKALLKIVVTFIPACVGMALNLPCWYCLKRLAAGKTAGTVFYDSVLFGLLFLCYPLYVLMLALLGVRFLGNAYGWILFLIAPLSAWFLMEFREAFRQWNNYKKFTPAQRKQWMDFFK